MSFTNAEDSSPIADRNPPVTPIFCGSNRSVKMLPRIHNKN